MHKRGAANAVSAFLLAADLIPVDQFLSPRHAILQTAAADMIAMNTNTVRFNVVQPAQIRRIHAQLLRHHIDHALQRKVCLLITVPTICRSRRTIQTHSLAPHLNRMEFVCRIRAIRCNAQHPCAGHRICTDIAEILRLAREEMTFFVWYKISIAPEADMKPRKLCLFLL